MQLLVHRLGWSPSEEPAMADSQPSGVDHESPGPADHFGDQADVREEISSGVSSELLEYLDGQLQ